MRRMLALVGKEWRDARVVTFGAAVAAVGLTFAAHETYFDYDEPVIVARSLVPGLLALYLVAVASDLIAAEMATRRMETNALLPMRPIVAWIAKAVFLLLAAAGFLAFLVALQVVVFGNLGEPGMVGAFLDAAIASPLSISPALAAGFVTLFFSTLIPRGFAAAVCGLAVVVGVGWGFHAFNWIDLDLDFGEDERNLLGLGLAAMFGIGSLVAFVGGRLHLDRRFRRIALGTTVVLVLSLVPGAVAARTVAEYLLLQPGDDAVRVTGMAVSPDGEHLAFEVRKAGTTLRRVWILGIDEGRVTTIPGRRARLPRGHSGEWIAWDAAGHLHVVDTERSRNRDGTRVDRTGDRWIDPTTGEVVRTDPEGVHAEEAWFQSRYWWKRRHLGGKGIVIEWRDRGISKTFPPGTWVSSTWRPGLVKIHRDGKRSRSWVLHDLESGRERVFKGSIHVSFDGRYLATPHRIVDLDTDRIVAGPWSTTRSVAWRSPGPLGVRLRPDHAHTRWRDEKGVARHSLLDLSTGEEIDLPASPHRLAILPAGRFVVRADDGRTVDLFDAEGKPLRRLYGPRNE